MPNNSPNPFGPRDRRPYPPMDTENGAGPARGQDPRFSYAYRPAASPTSEYNHEIHRLDEQVASLTRRNQALEADLQQRDRVYQDQITRNKDLNTSYQELHAHHQGALARCSFLDDEVQRLKDELDRTIHSKTKHKNAEAAFKADNERLRKENEKLAKKLNRSSKSPTPPRDQQADHLAQRFDRRSSRVMPAAPSSGSPYIEPFGPPAPRRRNSVSGGRYTVNVGHREEPRYSDVPRTPQEPGDYIAYPVSNRIV